MTFESSILGNLEPRKVRGPTLLKDIWKLPPGKVVDVPFNNRNQAIGEKDDWRNFDKEEKKKLVDFVRKFSIPRRGEAYVLKSLEKPSRILRDLWSGLVSYWLSDKAKRRSQANRNNRANQKMPHTGGSKSIATLMDEQAVNGIEPTRAQVFTLTHTKRRDGKPLDDDSIKAMVLAANSGHERVPKISRIPNVAENTSMSYGTTHLYPSFSSFFKPYSSSPFFLTLIFFFISD
ncbi:uncharacterized protein [Nicotiana sylvestris]|uniref:uncharacterized protein n=1 Tax=Nicotiana sylvestris TaxID=4096 RepID=UPI00388C7FF7